MEQQLAKNMKSEMITCVFSACGEGSYILPSLGEKEGMDKQMEQMGFYSLGNERQDGNCYIGP